MSRSNAAKVVLVADEAVVWRESAVVALCNENPQKVVARTIGVAESTLTRFLQSLGYTSERRVVRAESAPALQGANEKPV